METMAHSGLPFASGLSSLWCPTVRLWPAHFLLQDQPQSQAWDVAALPTHSCRYRPLEQSSSAPKEVCRCFQSGSTAGLSKVEGSCPGW